MIGVNYALKRLKKELELTDVEVVESNERDYVAMIGYSPVLIFRPVSAYLQRGEHFGLTAVTPQFKYTFSRRYNPLSDSWEEYDPLKLITYMQRYKPEDWKTITKHLNSILHNLPDGHTFSFYIATYNSYMKREACEYGKKLEKEAAPLKPIQESITSMIRQKVSLTDRAFIEISVEEGEGSLGWYTRELKDYLEVTIKVGVNEPYWLISSKLVASMPTSIDNTHPLIAGISNTQDRIELSVPPENPSIIASIQKDKKDPIYHIKMRSSGVDEEALETMIKLLLI